MTASSEAEYLWRLTQHVQHAQQRLDLLKNRTEYARQRLNQAAQDRDNMRRLGIYIMCCVVVWRVLILRSPALRPAFVC